MIQLQFKTFLGWTLSVPLKVSSSRETGNVAHVHFVCRNEKLTCDVQRLWDLETLGIPPVNEVHEEFVTVYYLKTIDTQ